MNVKQAIDLINHALTEEQDERIFKLYTSIYPWMNQDNFIPFGEFLQRFKQPIDQRKPADIIKELIDMSSASWEKVNHGTI